MKRIQEKIKDLVEVKPYQSLQNYIANPTQTLSAYHFTDATSDMMAKWLDAVSDVQIQSGLAKALAGYRGVGKSHFLATLGAIVSQPELRSRIADPYVSSSAQRLKRRRHPVAFVQRGTAPTLLIELKNAIAHALTIDVATLSDSPQELLNYAAKSAADLPFVILIDTSQDRDSRVMRDDGLLLGQLAEYSKNLNIFLAVALDDDIAGADGVNAAISRNYTIDYLDQEHLYRIVDVHLFPKQRQRQAVLHEIYQDLREVLPSFRWSEQRFTSLYPLHPIILEIAPFVRLYVPEFAFLGFASDAGSKVVGRPANSLIALDEVFDKTELSLRKSDDLQDAFAAFDKINAEIIGQIPIMQRLQARMILKALMLLSLDGDGTTASEISAAMLIYDENDPKKGLQLVEELLQAFAAGCPENVNAKIEEGRETRYSLKVSTKDSLLDTLSELANEVDESAIQKVLRRIGRENFPDWTFANEPDSTGFDTSDCQISWRGGSRRGRIVWTWGKQPADLSLSLGNFAKIGEHWDWEIVIKEPDSDISDELIANEVVPTVIWSPAQLNAEEVETLRRYSVLLNDSTLTERFAEQVRAAGHTHLSSVKKIWNRIFLEDAKLIINNIETAFTEETKRAETLSQAFSQMLQPLFEERYPKHPVFPQNLGINDVSQIVSELFSGKQPTPEVQNLAELYAVPLGLVSLRNGNYVLESIDSITKQDWFTEINSVINDGENQTIPLKKVYRSLKKAPFGLVREAQHLILGALVANRQIEFVTSNNDRIGRRSLDLKIIWDDIIGIARAEISRQDAALTTWAKVLTNVETFKSLENDGDSIRHSLKSWLNDWQSANVLKRFDALPNNLLTSRIWRLSSHTHKTFGAVATAVETTLEEAISLEEGLRRVSDAFADEQEEFFNSSSHLVELEDFINSADKRTEVWNYVALCELSNNEEIESLRHQIFQVIEELENTTSHDLNQKLNSLWAEFQPKFIQHFAQKHESVMKSHHLQEKYDEIMRTNEWWEFESLSNLNIFHHIHREKVLQFQERFKELNCNFNVYEMLKTKPFCLCSFRVSDIKDWETLPRDFWESITEARKSYRKTLRMIGQIIAPMLESLAKQETDSAFIHSSLRLFEVFKQTAEIPLLNNDELRVLERILRILPPETLQGNLPNEFDASTREEIREKLTLWLNNLPSEPMLMINKR